MSVMPIITFKAGMCHADTTVQPPKIQPLPTPGYLYLFSEDDLIHFCWRPRSASMSSPELELVMVPTDGQFRPYERTDNDASNNPKPATNGRIYVLKFSSSSQRHFFWMQSKSQSPTGDPSFFSARDLKLGAIVDQLLQGDDVDVSAAFAEVDADEHRGGDDDDETMEDVEGVGDEYQRHGGSGGAGGTAGATGDIRREGEESREGGAEGGRAAPGATSDTTALVQDFLASLVGGEGANRASDQSFATLADLLSASTTTPVIESSAPSVVDHLLSFLPPTLLLLAQEADDLGSTEPNSESTQAAIQALSTEQKKEILMDVLRSPQLHQSLGSLTMALRDGGLPSVSDALGVKVKNGGWSRNGALPLEGGEAVKVFVEGVKTMVQEESKESKETKEAKETKETKDEKRDSMDPDL